MATVTKTWVFASDNEGLADVGDDANLTVQHDTAGNPGGSLEFVGAATGAHAERARKATTGETWQTWGVPAGATVTNVQVSSWDFNLWSNQTSHRFRIRIVDSAGASVHSAGD